MRNFCICLICILYMLPNILTMKEAGTAEDAATNSEDVSQAESESNAQTDSSKTRKYPPLKLNDALYCPPEGHNREILEHFVNSANVMKTLIPKRFLHNEKELCIFEIEPILDFSMENGTIQTWGNNKNYHMCFFAFQIKSLPHIEVEFTTIYDMVYDVSIERVIQTRHKITSSADKAPKNLENQQTNQDEISTEPFCFDNQLLFSNMNKEFTNHNAKSNNYWMNTQMLVPKQHLSPIRQKAAKHFMNVAALWDELELLMNVIDNTILEADNQIKLKYPPNTNSTEETTQHELTIYTRLFYPTLGLIERVQTIFYGRLRIPQIWAKFVYYEAKKLGVLIFIHNSPRNQPQDEKYCGTMESVECNFNQWIGGGDLTVESQQYVYCCKAFDLALSIYFSIEPKVEDVLNLEDMALGIID